MAGGDGRAKGAVQRVAVGQRRGALLRDGVGAGVQTARALPLLPCAVLRFQGDELPVEPYARRCLLYTSLTANAPFTPFDCALSNLAKYSPIEDSG